MTAWRPVRTLPDAHRGGGSAASLTLRAYRLLEEAIFTQSIARSSNDQTISSRPFKMPFPIARIRPSVRSSFPGS
ncbi:protein of unknown function (plasmid) [Caballeronia sp. S22]